MMDTTKAKCDMRQCKQNREGICGIVKCPYLLDDTLFLWSSFSRDNIPKPAPKFKVGDTVKYITEAIVEEVYQDCDGTPLYKLNVNGYGVSDEELTENPELSES